jgi:hypothetical protein
LDCGPVLTDPDLIAERYWQIHAQPAGSWEREVLFRGA